MLLDFSTEFKYPEASEIWQQEIFSFINEWFSEDVCITSSTSGTTGTPKKISIPKSAMKLSAQMTGNFFDLKKGDSALLCMPVGFIAGKMMIVRAIELKLKLYCIEPKSKVKIDFINKIDFVPMTPMQVENSFDELSKIKVLLIGGAPLSDELRNKLLEIETQSFESYGMTETITHIALKKISEEHFTTLEKVKIRSDERDCLVIETPYFEEEIITNDIVEIISPNRFRWIGRFDNVINSGGVKLFPEVIEAKLKPLIQTEFIISSVPDNSLGQKLVLVVEGEHYDFEFPESLTKFEKPKTVYFVKKFPRTDSGKIKRNEISKLIQNQSGMYL